MKILILGDLHLRVRPPERRREQDFMAVCLGKLRQALTIASREECRVVVQPGDFFDSSDPSGELVVETIHLLKRSFPDAETSPAFLCVHGQHDLEYHTESAAKRSALAILQAAGVVWLIGGKQVTIDDVEFAGADWGQEPPAPKRGKAFRVLIAHSPVGDKPLWPGHDLTGPAAYVHRHPGFGLYVLGDYHYSWEWHADSRPVGVAADAVYPRLPRAVDAGVLIRKTVDKRELAHRPAVAVFNTEDFSLEWHPLDVAAPEVAFDLTDPPADAPIRQFDAFTAKLREQRQIGVDFEANLQKFFDAHGTAEPVRKMIWGAMEAKA